MIEPHHHIAAINSENKIKVDDPLVATCHGKNTYVWFLTREACIYIVNKIRSSSLPFDKTTVKKNLNSFFDNVESSLKTPYRALIDISYGVNGNNKLNLYADCSDMMLALKRIYESEKVRESLNGEENITINISIDKTTAIRQKI